MNQSKITVRYAKAFFDQAKEKNRLDRLKADIDLIGQVAKESTDFRLLLESPVVKTSQKIRLLNAIFEGKIDELTLRFLKIVTENKREAYLPDICRNFAALYRQEQGVRSVAITSAFPLGPTLAAQIKKQLEKEFQTQVELTERVNEDLIGGFILRIDDRQVDASVATKLRKVREKLLQTEINK